MDHLVIEEEDDNEMEEIEFDEMGSRGVSSRSNVEKSIRQCIIRIIITIYSRYGLRRR